MSTPAKAMPSLGEAGVLVAIAFGWFIAISFDAVARGFPTSASFSDANLAGMMVLEGFLGVAALSFLRLRGHSVRELLPSPDWRGCLIGALLCGVAVLAWTAVGQLLFSADEMQAQPIVEIASNARPSLAYVIALSMVNGLYEETFLLGYLVRAFAPAGASLALGLSLLVRVLYHLYQGPAGAVSILLFGLIVSGFYWRTRALWPAVFAHTLLDAVALA
jgi:uncharacterized protein